MRPTGTRRLLTVHVAPLFGLYYAKVSDRGVGTFKNLKLHIALAISDCF